MENIQKKIREIDLFDFTSFFTFNKMYFHEFLKKFLGIINAVVGGIADGLGLGSSNDDDDDSFNSSGINVDLGMDQFHEFFFLSLEIVYMYSRYGSISRVFPSLKIPSIYSLLMLLYQYVYHEHLYILR